jgi:hypothetical protein
MNKFNVILPAALACVLLFAAPARAAEDASHYQLSMALLEKLKAAETEMKLLPQASMEAPAANPDQSLEAAILKIEKDAPTTAVLTKHGLTGRDLVMSAHALLHAGTFVSMENQETIDKKQGADLYQRYTKEQQANIDLLRKMFGTSK